MSQLRENEPLRRADGCFQHNKRNFPSSQVFQTTVGHNNLTTNLQNVASVSSHCELRASSLAEVQPLVADDAFWYEVNTAEGEPDSDHNASSADEAANHDDKSEQLHVDFSPLAETSAANALASSTSPQDRTLESYDIISSCDVETSGDTACMQQRLPVLKFGTSPTNPKSADKGQSSDRPSKFPVRDFLRKHLAVSSSNRQNQHHNERKIAAVRGTTNHKSPAARITSAYPVNVASNSIMSQCMTPSRIMTDSGPRCSLDGQNQEMQSRNVQNKENRNSDAQGMLFAQAKPKTVDTEKSNHPFGGHQTEGTGTFSKIFEPYENALSQSGDAVKVRLQTLWNNVKYGWTVKPRMSFSKRQPMWLLGECHQLTDEREQHNADTFDKNISGIEKFRRDFVTRLWFTYRRDFARISASSTTTCAPETGNQSVLPPSYRPCSSSSFSTRQAAEPAGNRSEQLPKTCSNSATDERAFSTDCGWGCMLRSGQMLIAQAFVVHFLGRQWRWEGAVGHHTGQQHVQQPSEEDFMHRQIIRWCSDNPDSPFSLHSLVNVGHDLGRKAGDWFGPATLAMLLKKALINVHFSKQMAPNLLASLSPQSASRLKQLQIYVARDSTIDTSEVHELCTRGYISGDADYAGIKNNLPSEQRHDTGGEAGEWKYSLVMFIPARLGASRLNKMYMFCLEQFLTLSQCCGIIGGRPRHSLYFIGYQSPYLIYLDPHYCQKAVDTSPGDGADAGVMGFPLESFHCYSPRKMPFSKMDPSCTIGFYVRTRREFDLLRQQLVEMQRTLCESYPIFTFIDSPLAVDSQLDNAHSRMTSSPVGRNESSELNELKRGHREQQLYESASCSLRPTRACESGNVKHRDFEPNIDSGFVVL